MPNKFVRAIWADSRGRWNVRVSNVNVPDRTARERARRAIVSELTEREATRVNPRPRFTLRLEMVTRDASTITYRERT